MNTGIYKQWLDMLCHALPEVNSALFLLPETDGKNKQLLAQWPKTLDHIEDFETIVNYALKKNEALCVANVEQTDKSQCDYFALPILIAPELSGIVVVKTRHLPSERHGEIIKSLQKTAQLLQNENLQKAQNDDFYETVASLLVSCFEQKSYHQALVGLLTTLTQTLNCDSVLIGEYQNHHSEVVALSNSARFDVRSNFMQKIADAMDEAIEQDSIILLPDPQTKLIQRAHQEFNRKFGPSAILTIPLLNGEAFFGAITLLRSIEKPFNQQSIRLCEQTLALVSPFLALKKSAEQPITKHIALTLKNRIADLLGLKHLKIKLTASGLLVFTLITSLLSGDFNLNADAVLEGKIQRVVAAPISGFLVSASVRAGDTVRKGDLMASLDDAELQLELSQLNGKLQKFRREYREALSTNDLVKVRVASAQIDQASAEMELTQQKLQKITLTAPFDSVVIEGDLSQKLGSPVELGDTLFKIAPLEGYRIILKVNERDISFVKPGQKGSLALTGMPEQKLTLTVQKITAVAKADNGENIFRVEASLENAPDLLRPGMEGIGKINAGRQRLLWIWTHQLIDWLRLWFWSWLV